MRSLSLGVKSVAGRTVRKSAGNTERTGFCGVWKDDSSADEIIANITTHRSGYGRMEPIPGFQRGKK